MKTEFENNSFKVYHFHKDTELLEFAVTVLGLPNYSGLDRAGRAADYLAQLLPLTIVLEEEYIDKDWTSLLSLHYSTIFGEYPRFVKRSHVFRGLIPGASSIFSAKKYQNDYIGYFTVYPSRPRCIGRTVFDVAQLGISPGAMWCKDEVHLAGQVLRLSGFPFTGQDGKVVSCAHVAMWDIIRYYSTKYGYYGEFYQGDIAQICEDRRIGRAIPTRGLIWSQILAGFGAVRIRPTVYALDAPKVDAKVLADTARGYIRSGIPIILAGGGHAIVGIGLVSPNDPDSDIIVHDDNWFPYGLMSKTKNSFCGISLANLEFVFVPLYSKIVLPYETACKMADDIMLRSSWGVAKTSIKTASVAHRTFLTSSRTYLENLAARPSADIFEGFVRTVPVPKFVWVTELFDAADPDKLFGEYVLDATTSEHDNLSFLFLRYPEGYWYNERHRVADSNNSVKFIPTDSSPRRWEAFPGNLFKRPT